MASNLRKGDLSTFWCFQLDTLIASKCLLHPVISMKEGGISKTRVLMDGGGYLLLITEDMKNFFMNLVE